MQQARFVLVALVSVWMIGCATSSVHRGPSIDDQWRQIHSIALVDPKGPARITIADPNPAIWGGAIGSQLGLVGIIPAIIGAGIAESNMRHWSTEFETQKGTNSIDVPKELADTLRASLQRSGYLQQVVSRPPGDKLWLLPMADFLHMEGSDAYLDCVVKKYGYIHISAEGGTSNYIPCVIASAQLVSPRDQRVLFSRDFVATISHKPRTIMGIRAQGYDSFSTAEERFRYKTAKEVIANPENSIAGIRAGISNVCASICNALIAHTAQAPKLYVYNESSALADPNFCGVFLSVDDQSFFIEVDDYVAVAVSSGDHIVRDPNRSEHHKSTSSKHKKWTGDLHVEDGQCYYLKVNALGVKLKLVSQAEGEEAIARITHKFELRSTPPKDETAIHNDELKKDP